MLPALRDVEITRAFNGLMSFTPDGFPLLGESAAAAGCGWRRRSGSPTRPAAGARWPSS
jgi:glycine/D-amino acid oxidase-like deaminating enzyme